MTEASQRLNADRPEAHAALATLRLRQVRLSEAEKEYRFALELEPRAAGVAVNLADLFGVQNNELAGSEVLRTALQINPQAGIIHHALGLSLIRQKR